MKMIAVAVVAVAAVVACLNLRAHVVVSLVEVVVMAVWDMSVELFAVMWIIAVELFVAVYWEVSGYDVMVPVVLLAPVVVAVRGFVDASWEGWVSLIVGCCEVGLWSAPFFWCENG